MYYNVDVSLDVVVQYFRVKGQVHTQVHCGKCITSKVYKISNMYVSVITKSLILINISSLDIMPRVTCQV